MKPQVLAFVLATTALSGPVWAQSATGVGVGISSSRSDSAAVAASRSTAIGGGNATARGGTGIGTGGSVTIQGTTVPATTTQNLVTSGTSTVKNVPSVFAPGLAAAGLETCLGSVSGGGSFVGTGFSFGSTIPDPGCAARLDARTLWSMGLKKAAIARLCLGSDIRAAMPDVCGIYLPVAAPAIPTPLGSYYLSEGQTYQGGPIMLVDGRSGHERLCQNYDAPKQRCRTWDGETHVVMHHHSRPKVAAVVPTPIASPKPAQLAKTEGK